MSPTKYEPGVSPSEPLPTPGSIAPVVKRIRVQANAARAFKVFTEGLGSWWPKSHHIGNSPMVKAVLECRLGGRVYSLQEDGAECPWGQVTAWEPPARFVMAWQIQPNWHFEPDPSKCSEIEVTFAPLADGSTEVVLEHRNFERHGEGAFGMRNQVDQPGGWGALLELYRTETEKEA